MVTCFILKVEGVEEQPDGLWTLQCGNAVIHHPFQERLHSLMAPGIISYSFFFFVHR